ncbi:hypothetical protein [Mariniphaga sediminis]|uniref:hypothetical protein n=1 Tax=Mariniphaga sediminis TaxID=1628158 RepID=UPI0035660E48
MFIFSMCHEGHWTVKHIHGFASEYLMSWFPELGSYQAFSNRLNRLGGAFTGLVETLLSSFLADDCLFDQSLLDSM